MVMMLLWCYDGYDGYKFYELKMLLRSYGS